ncbi:MAG: hypothetical protein PHS79_06140 [Patescibacteria group bacterium]|nr:hypothetical protein [Patescibacteria group bacterium]
MASLAVIGKTGKYRVLSTVCSLPEGFTLVEGEMLSFKDSVPFTASSERQNVDMFNCGQAKAKIDYFSANGMANIVIESTTKDDLFKAHKIAILRTGGNVFTADSPEDRGTPSLVTILRADARRAITAGKGFLRKIGMDITDLGTK